jgi:formylglycine-generating enzyme required for sulfatase activity
VILAGEAIADARSGGVSPAGRAEVIKALQAVMTGDGAVAAVQRAAAGVTLARLGDPRDEVMTLEGMEFCLVPAGPFWMGSEERDDEKPVHSVEIAYDYFIGRYPVTNAQYDAFVQAGGYGKPDYWPEAERAGVWSPKGVTGFLDEQPRQKPYDWGRPFTLPNHPVVGVTWFEALAFTRWLTAIWEADDMLPEGWQVKLPSEAEWEKAARGGVAIPESPRPVSAGELAAWIKRPPGAMAIVDNPMVRRRYPWGDKADPERANYGASQIGATNAVGAFAGGRTPYGCEEMAGNVLEWTRNRYVAYPYQADDGRERSEGVDRNTPMVFRGGSWAFDENWPRCAFRNRYLAGYWSTDLGFRVVAASPFF